MVETVDQKKVETEYAIAILVSVTELHLEGRLLNAEGEKKLDKALEIIDKYQITNEEIGLYVKDSSIRKAKKKVSQSLRSTGVM